MSDVYPSFEPPLDEISAPFWAAMADGELRLPRCSACQRWQWYPDAAGPDCAGAAFEWVPVATTGVLHTFTRVHRSFLPGGGAVPFVVGFVDLDGVEGLRFVTNIADGPRVAIGARVAARFVDVDGRRQAIFDIVAV